MDTPSKAQPSQMVDSSFPTTTEKHARYIDTLLLRFPLFYSQTEAQYTTFILPSFSAISFASGGFVPFIEMGKYMQSIQ